MSRDGEELGPGAEFDLIRALVARWGNAAVGIGDDAAILRPARGESLVVSVDSAVEGRHFQQDWLTPREIGYRAVAAALSDLAAMAATPLGVLLAFGLPDHWRESLLEIADGVAEAATMVAAPIVGGNLTAAGELSITTTVVGSVFAPLTRSGAREGDRVYVTGRLGAPRAALNRFARGEDPAEFRARFARPVPRIREARWLAINGATAAIDISDGLYSDLRHLAASSRVTLSIDGDRVPRVEQVSVADALKSGEEYELAITAPAGLDADAFTREFGLELTDLGAVTATSSPAVTVRGVDDSALAGHDHFYR